MTLIELDINCTQHSLYWIYSKSTTLTCSAVYPDDLIIHGLLVKHDIKTFVNKINIAVQLATWPYRLGLWNHAYSR